MSNNQELQEEELEVLRSIYDGDDRFKEISSNMFQYKIGEEGDGKTLLLEVKWGPGYPEQQPEINMNTFYNKHLSEELKTIIVDSLRQQAETLLGMAMTYTLFEYVKENMDEMFSKASCVSSMSTAEVIGCNGTTLTTTTEEQQTSTGGNSLKGGKTKKEQLTKAQKRKLGNRQDINGEMPRGWNWVDVVKHLCQTGGSSKQEQSSISGGSTTAAHM